MISIIKYSDITNYVIRINIIKELLRICVGQGSQNTEMKNKRVARIGKNIWQEENIYVPFIWGKKPPYNSFSKT